MISCGLANFRVLLGKSPGTARAEGERIFNEDTFGILPFDIHIQLASAQMYTLHV